MARRKIWLCGSPTKIRKMEEDKEMRLPRVTTSYKEFTKLTKDRDISIPDSTMKFIFSDVLGLQGFYIDGVIWVAKLNPMTLLHEMVHHIIGHSSDINYLDIALFRHIFHSIWDVFCFRLTHFRMSDEQKRGAIDRIKKSIHDFLWWTLCWDVERL